MSLARFCTTIAALVLISMAIQPGQAANAAAPEAASLLTRISAELPPALTGLNARSQRSRPCSPRNALIAPQLCGVRSAMCGAPSSRMNVTGPANISDSCLPK
jgi:hypothetical protein